MARQIRVCFCIPNLVGGGAERVALTLAAGLDKERFETTLLVHERQGAWVNNLPPNLKVRFINEGPYRRTQLFRSLLETVREARRSDIIVGANEGRASVLALVAAKLTRKPAVAWVHVSWTKFGEIVSWRQRLSLRLYFAFQKVVAVSHGVADEFQLLLPRGAQRITVIHNPIDQRLIVEALEADVEPEHASVFDEPVVITAGRLSYQKNQADLIEAHAILRRRGTQHRLVILGAGDKRSELLERSRELGVSDTVAFLGFQANPYRYIARSQVFAFSSRFEGFALVLAEALTCGTPTVSYDCPHGPAEVLLGGKAGVLVPPGDVEGLADAIGLLLADKGKARELREAGRDHAKSFDLPATVGKWEALLSSLARN